MGIDLPRDIETPRLTWQRLARIIEHLDPENSATARARREHAPSLDVQFARSIEHGIRVLAWQKTKDGSTGSNPPKPIPLTGDPVIGGSRRNTQEVDALLAERQARRKAELARLNNDGNDE